MKLRGGRLCCLKRAVTLRLVSGPFAQQEGTHQLT